MDYSKYEVKMVYPKRPRKPILEQAHSSKAAMEYASKLEEHEAAMIEWRDAQRKWKAEETRLMEVFKTDVLEDLGITGHPKANKLYDMAWDRGHSSGLNSVYQEADELSELLV